MTGKLRTEEPRARIKKSESKSGKTQLKGIDDFDMTLWQFTEQSQDMIYSFDIPLKRFVFSNQMAADLYGQRADTGGFFTAKRVLLGIHPKDREKVKAVRDSSLKPGCSEGEVEYRFRDFHGNWRWLHDKWVVMRDESGKAKALVGITRDETSRKQLEEYLRNSYTYYRAVFDVTGTATVVVDEDMTISLVNRGCEIITGYKKSELEGGMKISDIIFKDDEDTVLSYYRLLRSEYSKAPKKYEFRVLNRSGQVKTVISTSDVLPGTSKIISSILDITEQKCMENELRESEERYRNLADSLPQISYEVDAKGKFTFVNRATLEITGYSQKDFDRGISINDTLISSDGKRAKSYLQKSLSGELLTGQVYTALRKDGSTFPILTYSSLVIRDGIPVGLRGVAVDITDLKKIEEVLQASESRYRTLIETSPDGIAVSDLNGSISIGNCKLMELYRFASAEELIGRNIIDMIAPEDRPRARENALNIMNKKLQGDIEYTLLRKDGTRFVGAVSSSVIVDPSGIAKEFISIIRDVTNKRLMEDALRDSEERLSLAASAAQAGLWIMNMEEGVVWATQELRDLLQFAPDDELQFERFLMAIHANDRERVRGIVRQSLERHEALDIEYRIVRPDGTIRWISSRGSPFSGVSGLPERLMGASIDVTERKERLDEIERLKIQLEKENLYLREEIKTVQGFEKIVGKSDTLQYILFRVKQVAPTDATVLILGETGTGKGLVANAIHELSARKDRSMITVNCAALPGNLIESELFGREKGAFTGAHEKQLGRFEVADGGTIFLDEIGEMPLELQVKLLRVLEEGEFERLGSPKTIKVDVRVIASTNRDLEAEVKNRRFRNDLFYRLNVFPVSIPPLRMRTEDIPQLVRYFVDKYARKFGRKYETVPKSTMKALQEHPWPGNVRELEHVIERAVITSPGPVLRFVDRLEREAPGAGEEPLKGLEAIERDHILKILQKTGWKIDGEGGAASILGLHPSTLRSRIKKIGIKRP